MKNIPEQHKWTCPNCFIEFDSRNLDAILNHGALNKENNRFECKDQPRQHILKIGPSGELASHNVIYDERFECRYCGKDSVRVTNISHPNPNGSFHINYECENCGEDYSSSY